MTTTVTTVMTTNAYFNNRIKEEKKLEIILMKFMFQIYGEN